MDFPDICNSAAVGNSREHRKKNIKEENKEEEREDEKGREVCNVSRKQ